MNDAARDQNPLTSYGADNLARLRNIASKDDKDRLFQKQQGDATVMHPGVNCASGSRSLVMKIAFRIAHHVPLDGALSYADLAQRCGLTEFDARRFIRAAISLHIFEENPVGYVRHHANSAALVSTLVHDSIGFATEEYAPAALKTLESLRRFPGFDRPAESPVAIASGITGELRYLHRDLPGRGTRRASR
ncbi:hypothetical protein DL765_003194 [Monosporascus sp. GIB2]|nr:hypothetical protein DL765_003194 [Monosporascus sp. GIB2]